MYLDVQLLHDFYYRSTLGRAAQRAIRAHVGSIWPTSKGYTVAGYGFAVPLLRPYLASARRVLGLMPGPQGMMHWPAGLPNVSVLVDEAAWPLETGHIDRLIVMHGLETADDLGAMLSEAYRVLGPGGRALFIVPNRSGLWSRSDRTPFGFGRPYSVGQLETILKQHSFIPNAHSSALFQPPSSRRTWLRTGRMVERLGQRMPFLMAGGVLVVEASKRYPPLPRGTAAATRRTQPIKGLTESLTRLSDRHAR